MAINFPNNPNPNDTWTSGGKTWLWDGTSWKLNSTPAAGISLTDLSVTKPNPTANGSGDVTYNNTTGAFTYTPPVVGSTSFIGLSDTPGSLTAGKWLKVNVGGTALEYVDNTFTNLTDTPSSLNAGKWLKVNAGGTALEWADAPSTGATSFTGLSDTPGTFTSQKFLKVNALGTALEWTDVEKIKVLDESVDTECYPLFTTEATGDLEPKTGSNIKFNSASGQLEAGSFKKTGGTAAEFLKADGSVDSTTYLSSNPSYALGDLSNVDATTNLAQGKILKYNGTQWEVADDNTSGGGGGATTINNNADNRIITGSASANTLNAESNLTFDGNNLKLENDKKITFGSNLRMEIYTDGSTNYIKTPTDGGGAFPLSIHSGSSEVINIDDGHTQIKTGIKDKDGDLGTAGQILSSTGTQVNWIDAPSGTNTTYDLSGVATANGFKTRLIGSDSTEDDVEFTPGGGISYSVTGNTCQISSVNTLSGLSDTTITASPNDNYVLTYDSASSKWEPQPVPSGSTPTLDAVLGAGPTSTKAATVGDFTCSNLTVNGTTTTVNSNTVNIGDNILTLNSDETGTPSQNAGLEIERGTSTNVSLRWNETTDKWQYTNDGTNYSDIGSSTTDTNTTYSISCVDGANTDEERIRLTASGTGSGTDDIVLEAGTGLTIARSGDKITFANSETDTKYDLTGVATGSGFKIRLAGDTASGNTNDDIELTPGGGISYSVSGNTCQISSVNSLSGLSDVDIGSSPSTGQVLKWNGSKWTNDTDNTGGSADGNNYASSLSWNSGNGVLTVNRSGLSSLTVDLDGRYAIGTIPTNNNQLTNGANYVTSSGTITNSEKVRIRTDTGSTMHNLVFVDSYSDNQFQVLKVDNATDSLCYNPSANRLIAQDLQSFRMTSWTGDYGDYGQFLMSVGSGDWEWSQYVQQKSNGELLLKATGGLEGGHLQFEDMTGSTSYAIDVYRNSSGADKVLRFVDQSQSKERFSVGPQGQWGIGHVGARNYGSTGQVMISGGPSSPPYWGNHSQISGSSFASTAQGEKADAADTDIDNIYTKLVAIGNDDTITTVAQLKTALLALVRS